MKIGIVGGGFMGLVLAYKLSRKNVEVKVFERETQKGGLSTHHNYGNFIWDKFYHAIVPSDANLVRLIRELGLGNKLNWRRSSSGYYVNKTFYSMSNSKDFVLFPALNLWNKFMLAYTIFYGSRISNWKNLEKITTKDWLIKLGGKKTFEKFWEPLLLAKLGEKYDQVSAVFIWTYIKRLFKAREYPAQKEEMGYVAGGYKTIFDRMDELLEENDSKILCDTRVQDIQPALGGGINVHFNNEVEHFDKVVFTAPLNILEKVTAPSLFQIDKKDQAIEYLGVICLVLISKTKLSPYYILNLADSNIPFTGVIGMSSLIDSEETKGEHITYFPKYITADHPYWGKSDEELKKLYLKGVRLLYPDLDSEDIIEIHLNRAFKVQPLQVLDYSEHVPQIHTLHDDFYVLNTSQFVNDSVNNNSVVTHVMSFLEKFEPELKPKEAVLTS